MKPIIAALLFCMLSFTPEAQELNKTISKLNFEEAVTIDNIKIKLVKIISDSRCPKNVSCIRAGEAKILVDVFKDGKLLKQQQLIFYPTEIDENDTTLYISDTLKISGLNLLPYPDGIEKIKDKNYYLELAIEN